MFLQCFAWAAVGQHWRETAQGQGPLWQSQTGAFSPLKVGAVGEKGICPVPYSHPAFRLAYISVPISIQSLGPEGSGIVLRTVDLLQRVRALCSTGRQKRGDFFSLP